MPSYCIHLAIGNLYAIKNPVKDKNAFLEGVIAPDFEQDKERSHYSDKSRSRANLVDFLAKKVRLDKYLSKHSINSDYERGVFLHLVTDYIFFTSFFSPDLINAYGQEFLPTMYFSYDIIKDYVEKKYQVVYPGKLEVVMQSIEEKRKFLGFDKGVQKDNIIPVDKLDRFIEYCSGIELDKLCDIIRRSDKVQVSELTFSE